MSEVEEPREMGEDQQSILAILGRLLAAGVAVARVKYDGSGDSGSIDYVQLYDIEGNEVEQEWNEYGSSTTGSSLYNEIGSDLYNYSYGMMPGGWEINDGSYGNLIWDTRRLRVYAKHFWRHERLTDEADECSVLLRRELPAMVKLRAVMDKYNIRVINFDFGGSGGDVWQTDWEVEDTIKPNDEIDMAKLLAPSEVQQEITDAVCEFIEADPGGMIPEGWEHEEGGMLEGSVGESDSKTPGLTVATRQYRSYYDDTDENEYWVNLGEPRIAPARWGRFDVESEAGAPTDIELVIDPDTGDVDAICKVRDVISEEHRDFLISMGHANLDYVHDVEMTRDRLRLLGVDVPELDRVVDRKLKPLNIPEADLHPFHHAVSSANKHGGVPEDYLPIHNWFDESKHHYADLRHRAARHHSEGIQLMESIFGPTIKNSAGKEIPTRFIGEQHVKEDLGRIPTLADWLRCVKVEAWMGTPGEKPSEVLNDPDYRPLDVSKEDCVKENSV